MKVKDLIKILQRHDPEAEIFITESEYDWHDVLKVMEDPSNPDDGIKNPEISFE